MVDLRYEWFNEILQDFFPIRTKHRVTLSHWIGKKWSRLKQKLKTLRRSYITRGKLALKIKIEEIQTELTLSTQNDQFNYETKVFHKGKFSALSAFMKTY